MDSKNTCPPQKDVEYLQQAVQELSSHEGACRLDMLRYLVDMAHFELNELFGGESAVDSAGAFAPAIGGYSAQATSSPAPWPRCTCGARASDAR